MTKWTKKSIEEAYEKGRMDFSYENFAGLDLEKIYLVNAILKGANLKGANLIRATLSGTNLIGANLAGANLTGANLNAADLRKADLRGADMTRTDLRRADLRKADLDYSSCTLWCGSLDVRVDERIAAQLMYHVLNVMLYSDIKIPNTRDELIDFANQIHRTDVERLE